jgi:hypothetical protein
MLNRASRLIAARVVLALMLFAQGAMAWSACQLPERAPELALRAAVEHQGCEQMTASNTAVSNVCFTHSLSEKQSLYKPALDVPAMPAGPVLTVTLSRDWHFAVREPHGVPKAATGPPRRILLQSFQI